MRFALSVLLAGLLCPAQAQLRQTPSGPLPKPEAPPKLQPLPKEKDWQSIERVRRANQDTLRRYYLPPFSPVAAPLGDVYSRKVNRITCAVTVPSAEKTGVDETWLGTRLGIKQTVKGKGVTRHYTMRDGLPGDVVEDLAADANGTVALVRTPEGLPALAWWNRRTDTWDTIARVPPADPQEPEPYDKQTRWHCVLTPTRVLLIPPYISLPGSESLAGSISVWERGNLEAGQFHPRHVRWDGGLASIPSFRDSITIVIQDVAVIGETLFIGSRVGLVAVPDLTLAEDTPFGYRSTNLLSAAPRMPRFWDSVQSLAVRNGTLWVLCSSHIVAATPIVRGGLLLGLRQKATALPSLGYYMAEKLRENRSQVIPTASGPWLTIGAYFLHHTGTAWEWHNEDGRPVKSEPALPRPDSNYPFDYLSGYSFSTRPLIAPSVPALPDAVVQASVLERDEDTRWTSDTHAIARRVAWTRQRLPYYYSRSANPPRLGSHGTTAGNPLPENVLAQESASDFFRDPFLPGTVWHYQDNGQPGSSTLLQISAANLPPWHLEWQQRFQNRPTFEPVIGAIAPTAVKTLPLPVLPIRVHLPVLSMGVREDGLYAAVYGGVLFFPAASLSGADKTAGARWVPQATEKGFVKTGGNYASLYQGPANRPLILDQFSLDNKTLTYHVTTQQFVLNKSLPPGSVLFANRAGAMFSTTRTEVSPQSTFPDRKRTLHFVPLRPDGTADAATPVVLPEELPSSAPNFPFLNPVFQPMAFSQGKLWYTGLLSQNPSKPRYPHEGPYYALAGYDVQQKRWTTPRELPRNWFVGYPGEARMFEEGTTLFAAFNAPDGSIWQYESEKDTWRAVAPPLPGAMPDAALPIQTFIPPTPLTPLVWKRQGGQTWVLFQGAVYRYEAGGEGWSRFDATPALSALRANPPVAPHWYVMAAMGDGLFLGGDLGLWRFDTKLHTWTEIAPLTSSLPDTQVNLPATSYAADKNQVYLAGSTKVNEFSPLRGGFLVTYDRKGTWQALTPEQLNVSRFTPECRVWSDGLTVWFTDGDATRRRDPSTGNWQITSPPLQTDFFFSERSPLAPVTYEKIVATPTAPGSPYLFNDDSIARYDTKSGQLTRVMERGAAFLDDKKYLPLEARIRDVFAYKGGLIAVTSLGQYRIDVQKRTAERLLSPTLDAGSTFTTNEATFAWDPGHDYSVAPVSVGIEAFAWYRVLIRHEHCCLPLFDTTRRCYLPYFRFIAARSGTT